jgi:hypothetical protein
VGMSDSEELVDAALRDLPSAHQAFALRIRDIIRDVAEQLDLDGGLIETLKWGQPSWLPARRGIGTTVRLAVHNDTMLGLLVHCQTNLLDGFRLTFGDELSYSDNRAVLFDVNKPLPEDAVRHCVTAALTYHRNKRT